MIMSKRSHPTGTYAAYLLDEFPENVRCDGDGKVPIPGVTAGKSRRAILGVPNERWQGDYKITLHLGLEGCVKCSVFGP